MPDIIADGQPFEMPEEAADAAYAQTPPSFGEAFKSMALEYSPLRRIAEAAERGTYAGASPYDVGLAQEFADEGTAPGVGATPPQGGSIQTPMLSADQVNSQYAPVGPDGQKVKITDAPMAEGVAQLVGQEKADQIERDGVISRFQNAHSWPVNFGTGIAAFMADPLNLTTAFIPGFGEEALGGGLAARIAGRAVSGAATGAAAQAPLSAVRYGLDPEEASEYGLRDAFRDLFYSAAGNAAVGVGFKAAGEIFGRSGAEGAAEGAARPETSARAAFEGVQNADAATKYDAMRTATAQVLDGRPVDVAPVFAAHGGIDIGDVPEEFDPSDLAADQAALYRDGFAPGMTGDEFAGAKNAVYGPEAEGATPEEGEPDLAAAERSLTDEDRAALGNDTDLAATEQRMNDANDEAAIADEAGACLKGAA